MLEDVKLSDFEKEIIRNGQEVEVWARKLFSNGVLVESREEVAVADTEEFLSAGKKVIFQASFQTSGLYAMVDILQWDEDGGYWIINEVKATSAKDKKDKKHVYDAAFQYILLKMAGLNVGKVNLVELNKEFRKNGEIDVRELIEFTDITEKVKELEEEINEKIVHMKTLLDEEKEPLPCECLYKSRGNHCPAFGYLYPDVPDYSVHDIVRIGSSKKKLEGLVEGGYIAFEDVPEDFKLSPYQRNHVNVTQTKGSIIHAKIIKKQLDDLVYPLYFLDYETCPTAVPIYDGCKPYQQVPFQYSLHVLEAPNVDLEHYEFLYTGELKHPMKALAESLMKVIGDMGSIIVWNDSFEGKCHRDIAELMPEYEDVFLGYNKRFYDLMEIFQKNLYVHHDFKGSYSIKAVLPVLVPGLTYDNLNIRDGAMAMTAWKTMMFEMEGDAKGGEAIAEDLLRYCELDTLAMVRIFEVLGKL
ncbi:DUF2779 domain-containing protein [Candidatus Peregrinibacteria bacterium]|nr:DUF2779 domain-containing protein [Candidatus Peregrinibacteria bacterium]